MSKQRINYGAIARDALDRLPLLVLRWLPDGRREGSEWVARNPKRNDQHAGSFKINLKTGKWADFATGDKGGDVISFAAYLHDLSQASAATKLAALMGTESQS